MLWISLVITHPAQHFPSKLLISPGKGENNPRETREKPERNTGMAGIGLSVKLLLEEKQDVPH